jgi:hypothetical protein
VRSILARANRAMLPSMRWDHVGTRKLHAYFGSILGL